MGTDEMRIRDAIIARERTEDAIAHALIQLENDTGLEIVTIELERSHIIRGYATSPIAKVNITLVV